LAFDVIGAVVAADFLHELGVAFFGFDRCHGEKLSRRQLKRKAR
jgi:hypothetical protein